MSESQSQSQRHSDPSPRLHISIDPDTLSTIFGTLLGENPRDELRLLVLLNGFAQHAGRSIMSGKDVAHNALQAMQELEKHE